jgi:hypothetical protein
MSREYFYELQKYTQWWIWLISISTVILLVGIMITVIAATIKSLGIPLSSSGMIVLSFFCILGGACILWLQGVAKTESKVDRMGFSYRFFPITKSWKTIQKEQIKNWKVTHEQQLELLLFSGEKFFFGTRQPDQLSRAMTRLFDTKVQQ